MRWTADWFAEWNRDWFGPSAAPAAPGAGPEGVATFALELQNGYTVTYRWGTDILRFEAGIEKQRISRNDHPKEIYAGNAMLFGGQGAHIRAQLARYATQGKAFSLALPHEELTLAADSTTTVAPVTTTAYSDWLNPGQRAVVVNKGTAIEVVVQTHTANTITFDKALGAIGKRGARIMPLMPVYLEPEQAFARHRTQVETWELRARAAIFGFASQRATLALGPITASSAFDNAFIESRLDSAAGNALRFRLVVAAINPQVNTLVESNGDVTFYYTPGWSTMGNFEDALAASAYERLAGSFNRTDTIAAGDAFAYQSLSGGDVGGPQGSGATLTQYLGTPVWHREIVNAGTNRDSIQAHTQIIDFGGLPYAKGYAGQPSWGRAIVWKSKGLADWQWFKLFMATVVGRQRSFWLPTWRDDLPCVGIGADSIIVAADVAAWWPAQRQYVQIKHAGGIGYYQVGGAADNGDGTWTLSIGTTLSGVTMVSWLELVRFASDDMPVRFDKNGYSISTAATVVQQ